MTVIQNRDACADACVVVKEHCLTCPETKIFLSVVKPSCDVIDIWNTTLALILFPEYSNSRGKAFTLL